MDVKIDARRWEHRACYDLGEHFAGVNPEGVRIGWTNRFMTLAGSDGEPRPFPAVSGEIHYSRLRPETWRDELLKMKAGGIDIAATYLFWNHHEEKEGIFDFTGAKDVRRFLELSREAGLFVILRVGPFAHGECRNGGFPDWMFGKPYTVRTTEPGFLAAVESYFGQIGKQVEGMMYGDGGPVIAVQLDNEYEHSSAPWEMTAGTSDEWIHGGDGGEAYLYALRDIAKRAGLTPPFYTCTAWGGAVTPDEMLPLWGGYPYRPWIFLNYKGDHPATEEYVYQDYGRKGADITDDFVPRYDPETRPYACCEMAGGMMQTVSYRFTLPFEAVDALANIKLGSGCCMPGYYMYHGGTNPVAEGGICLNEGQVPKRSYDYQAPLGEFGQVRQSFYRLRLIHDFLHRWGEDLLRMETVLPEGASRIGATDTKTLRFAVRTDGKRGFLFLNNFQDHQKMEDRSGDRVTVELADRKVVFEDLGLSAGENAIFPFSMDLGGKNLAWASAQPVTEVMDGEERLFIFVRPDGSPGRFVFEDGTAFAADLTKDYEHFAVGEKTGILLLGRSLAEKLTVTKEGKILFADGVLLEDGETRRIESDNLAAVTCYGKGAMTDLLPAGKEQALPEIRARQVSAYKWSLEVPDEVPAGLKDCLVRIEAEGNIAWLFQGGRLVSDCFLGGPAWEISLSEILRYGKNELTLVISPLKKGQRISADSAMAARSEQADEVIGSLGEISLSGVWERSL